MLTPKPMRTRLAGQVWVQFWSPQVAAAEVDVNRPSRLRHSVHHIRSWPAPLPY